TLNAAGTYTLLVEGYIGDTGTATFTLNLVPVSDLTKPLTLGATVRGSLAGQGPGEVDRYTFNLSSSSLLYFLPVSANNYFQWTLSGPGGTVVSNRSFSNGSASTGNNFLESLPVPMLLGGNYTLTISLNGQAGSSSAVYSFRLVQKLVDVVPSD